MSYEKFYYRCGKLCMMASGKQNDSTGVPSTRARTSNKHINYYLHNGYYPSRVFIDKLYATKKNLEFLKSIHIQFIGLPLGMAKAEYIKAQKELLEWLGIRNEVEGCFGLDKRK